MAKFKAAINCSVDLSGLEGTIARLAQVDRKAARTAIRKGVNEVTKLVLDEARALVPVRSAALKKSLGRKVKAYKGGAVVLGVVKPRSGVWVSAAPGVPGKRNKSGKKVWVAKFATTFGGRKVNPVYYAHLVEFGRGPVVVKQKKVLADKAGGVVYGTRVRAMAPRPFLRPAWEAYRSRAPQIVARFLHEALAAFWKRSRGSR